jgi:hypothetical protein
MIVGSLLVGFFFIGIGFLNAFILSRYPNAIGFYSAIPTEKKKDVDIAGLAAFTKKGFIILGAMIIVLSFIFIFLNLEKAYIYLMQSMAFGGMLLIYIKSVNYLNYNVKKNKFFVYILFGILIFITLLLMLVIEYTQR